MDIVLKENKNRMVKNHLKSMSFSEIALFVLTLLLWTDRILLTYVRAIMMRLPIIGFMADYMITAVYVVLIVFSVPRILKCMQIKDLFFVFTTVIICLLNYLVFPDNTEILDDLLPNFLFFTFPLYFIGLSLDYEKVFPWMYRLSLVTIAAFTVYKLFISTPMTDTQSIYQGDMWGAYNILPHVCVAALAMLKKPGFINIASSVLGILMLSFLGSRGPLLCAVMAIVFYLILFKKYKKPFLAYSLIILGVAAVMIGMNSIMSLLYFTSQETGLSIRIFEKFFEGSFSDSSTRDVISSRLLERIVENPVFGYGLFSDRAELDTYAHHIAIELWHSFGVPFGTAVLGGIVVVLFRAAKVVKKVDEYALLFIPLLFSGFVKLFLSGSCMEEIYLFLLLGVSVSLKRRKNLLNGIRNVENESIEKSN